MTDDKPEPETETDAAAEPAPVDPHFVDPEAPIDAEEIQKTARENFSLTDRLKGIKHRHTRILIYTDLEAVDAYSDLNRQAEKINDTAGKIDLKKTGGPEQHAALLEQYNALEPQVDAARQKMLSTAIAIEMRAYPNIAVKVARRDSRKKFSDKDGNFREDQAAEASEYMDQLLFGESIISIKDVGSQTDIEFDRKTVHQQFSDDLPSSQWTRLFEAWLKLTLTDQIGKGATDEPGF